RRAVERLGGQAVGLVVRVRVVGDVVAAEILRLLPGHAHVGVIGERNRPCELRPGQVGVPGLGGDLVTRRIGQLEAQRRLAGPAELPRREAIERVIERGRHAALRILHERAIAGAQAPASRWIALRARVLHTHAAYPLVALLTTQAAN